MLPRGVGTDSHACGLVGEVGGGEEEWKFLRFFLRFLSIGIGPLSPRHP